MYLTFKYIDSESIKFNRNTFSMAHFTESDLFRDNEYDHIFTTPTGHSLLKAGCY